MALYPSGFSKMLTILSGAWLYLIVSASVSNSLVLHNRVPTVEGKLTHRAAAPAVTAAPQQMARRGYTQGFGTCGYYSGDSSRGSS